MRHWRESIPPKHSPPPIPSPFPSPVGVPLVGTLHPTHPPHCHPPYSVIPAPEPESIPRGGAGRPASPHPHHPHPQKSPQNCAFYLLTPLVYILHYCLDSMSTPKIHNNHLSINHRPSHGAPAQEAVGPSSSPFPGSHLPPDARGAKPRKTARGPAPFGGAILTAPDACGNLPQKKTRTPVPARRERSRRGRPYPQNRDGSGKAGSAEGSLPRLAPEGRGFEQEIILLRSMINRLLSRRPLNHTYISRYMRLLIQAQSAQAKAPKDLTDEQEVDSLIKKLFYKRVDEGKISFYDLLPVRTSQPGEKWWPWRQLMTVGERRRDGLVGPEDRWPSDVDEYLDKKAAHEAEMAAYKAETWRDMEAVLEGMFANDPVLSNLYDPDQEPPDEDDDSDPDDNPNPPSVLPSPEPVEDVEDAPRRAPGRESIPDPLSVIPAEVADAPRRAGIHPSETITSHLATHPSPSPEPPFTPIQSGAPNYWETDSFSSHVDPPGQPPDWPDPNPHPKPRIARGRPPP